MAYKISSFSDRNFLKLGIFCIAAGCILALLLQMIDAPWWIAFRGGLGLGIFIIAGHYIAVYHAARRSK